jgi:hypothetical protein
MHVRLLVAAPVFLIIDQLFPRVCSVILEQLVSKSFVPEAAEAAFQRLLRRSARLASSWVPEALLGAISIGLGVGVLLGVVPASGIAGGERHWTPAQLWYAITDWPLVQFLLWRSLWRWVIWVRMLCGLARIPLALVPTHPDRCGGISFLRLPSVGYCAFLLFAAASMLCAEWGEQLASPTLTGFKPLLALFAGVGALIAFGPLLVFSPQLVRARLKGVLDCGGRACDEGRRFRRQLADRRRNKSEPSNADLAALAEVTVVYREAVDRMQFVLVDRRDLIWLIIATLLPVVPMMLSRVPLEEWRELSSVITGGRL